MSKLKKDYNPNGELRVYRLDNDTMLKSYETMLKKALNNLGRYMEIGIDNLTSKIIEPLYIAS